MLDRSWRRWVKSPPSQVADAPSKTKTTEKPSTNRLELIMAVAVCLLVQLFPVVPSRGNPATNAMYPGISGNTQGERNDNKPATKTIINDKSVCMLNTYP